MDKFLLDLSQIAYNWVWDRFGFYKGQIMTGWTLVPLGYCLVHWYLGMAFVLLGFLPFGWYWTQLQKRSQIRCNLMAENYSTSLLFVVWRHFLIVMFFVVTILDFWRPPSRDNIFYYMLYISLFLHSYIPTIYVRDREPPEHRSFVFGA